MLFMSSNGLSDPSLPLSLMPVPGFIPDGPLLVQVPAFLIVRQISKRA